MALLTGIQSMLSFLSHYTSQSWSACVGELCVFLGAWHF